MTTPAVELQPDQGNVLLDIQDCKATAKHTEDMLQRLVQARRQTLCSTIVQAFIKVPELQIIEVHYSNRDEVYVHGTDVIVNLQVDGKTRNFSVEPDAYTELAAYNAGMLEQLLAVRNALDEGGMVDLYLFDYTTVLDGGGKIYRHEALTAKSVYDVYNRLSHIPRNNIIFYEDAS